MTYVQGALSSLTRITAVVVSVVFLLLPPASYGVVAYLNLVAQMDREVELHGQAINFMIATAPQLWTYQEVRFTELLSRHGDRHDEGQFSIFDDKDGVVASIGEAPAWPLIARAVPLFDSGFIVGRVENIRSLRGLLANAALLFVFGAVLAAAAFVTLRVVPLRELQRVNASLQQRDKELAFANTLLTATSEGSPDGMLVVNENGRIVSYNQRFTAMWEIPPALVETRDDEQVLRTVASRLKDPAAFIARVEHLYSHPEESSQDRIYLKDGRVFERYSRSLYDPGKKYLGRVWFFTDVTERETLTEAIRTSEEKFRNLVEATTDFIWATDGSGLYTYASPAIKALTGYEPEEIVGRSPFDYMSPGEARRASAQLLPIMAARRPFTTVENNVLRKDGGEIIVETSGVPVFDAGGAFTGYRGIDRDITSRKRAEQALERRDALLHAVTLSAAELASAPGLDEAMPKVLKLIGETVRVDRIVVFELPWAPGELPGLRYGWTGADAPFAVGAEFFTTDVFRTSDVAARLAPLRDGEVVALDAATATGSIRKILEAVDTKSVLLVPVTIDSKYWGHVAFDSCSMPRHWETFEVEIFGTLSGLIGNAIQRERYVKELRDAMRIVQDTPTILYRLSSGPAMAVSYVSQNIKLFGYEPEAFTSSAPLFMTIIHPDDLAKVREALTVTLEADSRPGIIEHRMLTSRGTYRWVENRFTPVRDPKGRLIEIEGMLVDVTDRKAAEEKIALLARSDALTGLANRATFVERLRLAFAAARRGAPAFAVLYLDLDHFKNINDSFGHPFGDVLLQAVAERLKSSTRGTDLVARPGGDEFAILQTDLSDSADAGALAVKIRAALALPLRLEGRDLHITASVGIAMYTPEITASEDMLARADLALYRAKDEGRDQYRFHSEELDEQVRLEVSTGEELKEALARDEFELYFQPQVELSSGRIVGMEALLRWNHPTRGQIHPLAFLAIAEKIGAMTAIGTWVLDHACRQMNAWRRAGIAPPTIAVNVSLSQLKNSNEFVQVVENTLAKWGMPGSDLELDVTESMLAHTTLAQNDVLERLQKLGVKIAIDDFGTKFSSLDYLRTYRVSRLKIPKSMVDAATLHTGNAAMVRAITSIARELNVEVVAQGVETEAQWSFLTATTPSTNVQGYFYSMPVPAERAAELLHDGVIKPSAGLAPAPG